MRRFNTGNPLGSGDPRDLDDNAKNMDLAVNSDEPSWSDRLGRDRKSFEGMEREFDADQSSRDNAFESAQAYRESRFNNFIVSSGYQFIGDYGPGIEFTEYNQLVRDENGEFWRLSGQVELPYTTTGAGIPEDDALVPAGDAVLRQDLANPDKGGDLVQVTTSTGEQTLAEALDDRVNTQDIIQPVATFDSVSDMVASENLSIGDKAKTLGYYEPGDGGGNDYEIVAAGTGTDDGGSFIDLSGSGLQARGLFRDFVSAAQFGANGNSFEDQTQQIQRLFDFCSISGKTATVSGGEYGISDVLVTPSNLTAKFNSSAIMKRIGTNGGLMNNYILGTDISGRSAFSNIRISGGVWDGQGSVLGSNSIINIAQAENVILEDMEITDCRGGHHIEINGAKNVTIRDCRISVYTDPGDREFSEAIQIDFMGSEELLPGLDLASYDGTPCEDILIENIEFKDTGRTIGSHSWDGDDTHWAEGITIRGIKSSNCSHDVLRPQGWRKFVIEDVVAETTGPDAMFIRVEDCEDFVIRNVECLESGSRGIWVRKNINATMENWSIENARIFNKTGTGAAAIEMLDVGAGNLKNSYVGQSSNWGINISGCSDVVVDSCRVGTTYARAVRMLNNVNTVVMNCTLLASNAERVIDIRQGQDQRALENTIFGLDSGFGITSTDGAVRALIRGNRIFGNGGTGIQSSATASGTWIDANDTRGLSGTKIDSGSASDVITNNQE